MSSGSLNQAVFETRTEKCRRNKKEKEPWGEYSILPKLTHPHHETRPLIAGFMFVVGLTDRYAPFVGIDGVRVAIELGILFVLTNEDAAVLMKRGAVRCATPEANELYQKDGRVPV